MLYSYVADTFVNGSSIKLFVANPVYVQVGWSNLYIDWLVNDDISEDPKGPDGYDWNSVESPYHVSQGKWKFSNILIDPSEPSSDDNNCMSIVLKQSFCDLVINNFSGMALINFEFEVSVFDYGYNPDLSKVRVIVSELGVYNNDYIGYSGLPYYICNFFSEEDINPNFSGTKTFQTDTSSTIFMVDNWSTIQPPVFSIQGIEGVIKSLKLNFAEVGPDYFWKNKRNCIDFFEE